MSADPTRLPVPETFLARETVAEEFPTFEPQPTAALAAVLPVNAPLDCAASEVADVESE